MSEHLPKLGKLRRSANGTPWIRADSGQASLAINAAVGIDRTC